MSWTSTNYWSLKIWKFWPTKKKTKTWVYDVVKAPPHVCSCSLLLLCFGLNILLFDCAVLYKVTLLISQKQIEVNEDGSLTLPFFSPKPAFSSSFSLLESWQSCPLPPPICMFQFWFQIIICSFILNKHQGWWDQDPIYKLFNFSYGKSHPGYWKYSFKVIKLLKCMSIIATIASFLYYELVFH